MLIMNIVYNEGIRVRSNIVVTRFGCRKKVPPFSDQANITSAFILRGFVNI